jgi:hypothetical protein
MSARAGFLAEDARLTGQCTLLNGFSFADFVLAAVVAFEQHQHLRLLIEGKISPPRRMPNPMYRALYMDAPAMSWACTYLYARFQHHAPFRTLPGPARPLVWADVDNIYADRLGRGFAGDQQKESL